MYSFVSIASAALMCISSHYFAGPLKYNVLISGSKVGSATVLVSGNDATGYQEEATVELKKDGHSFTQHQVDHYGRNGTSTSTFTTFNVDGHSASITANFTKTGAEVSLVSDGKAVPKKTVPMLANLPHLDVSHLWFSHVRPAVGTSLTFQSFSSQDATWHKETAKYVGTKTIQVGGKSYSAHEISESGDQGASTVYLDDQGNLVKGTQAGNVTIELASR